MAMGSFARIGGGGSSTGGIGARRPSYPASGGGSSGGSSGSKPGLDDEYKKLLAELAKSSGGGTTAPPPALTGLTAEATPEHQFAFEGLKGLSERGTEQEVGALAGAVRDWEARGQSAMTPGQVARGVTGTGVQHAQFADLAGQAQRNFAKGVTDIEMGETERQRKVFGDISRVGSSRAATSQADKALQLRMAQARQQRWEAEQRNIRESESAALSKMLATLEMAGFNSAFA